LDPPPHGRLDPAERDPELEHAGDLPVDHGGPSPGCLRDRAVPAAFRAEQLQDDFAGALEPQRRNGHERVAEEQAELVLRFVGA
jgi:hypothetical protein